MIKILFAGSPDAARVTLERLIEKQTEKDFVIAGVLSNPPSAKGRHHDLIPTPVAAFAIEKGIPVFTPEHLDGSARDSISPLKADLLVSFAYGHIFGPKFLAMFSMGGINLHPSLLPKYRGCTPVPAAILNRDKQTAVTIQTLSLKMDEGNILAQTVVDLDGTETGESLLNYAAEEGANLILSVIEDACKNGKLSEGTAQSGNASYTGIINKNDGKIDWNMKACEIEAKIRAYFPEPGCWCMEGDQTLRILSAKIKAGSEAVCEPGKVMEYNKSEGILVGTGGGVLCVQMLQRQGKKAMNYKDFMNGARDFVGTVLE